MRKPWHSDALIVIIITILFYVLIVFSKETIKDMHSSYFSQMEAVVTVVMRKSSILKLTVKNIKDPTYFKMHLNLSITNKNNSLDNK